MLADGFTLYLAYNADNPEFPGWSGGASLDHLGFIAKVAVVHFDMVRIHRFGYPNSEALGGHPLYKSGLQFYAFHSVEHSPWIAELCRQNKIHPRHKPSLWDGLTHWVVTFEDDTLEVVAEAAALVGVYDSTTPEDVLQKVSLSRGEQDSPANGSQPIRAETNSASSVAGSRH